MLVNINDAIAIPGKFRFQLQSVWNVLHLCLLKIKSTYLVSILFLYMNIYIYLDQVAQKMVVYPI